MERPLAIQDYEGLCFKCLQKKDIKTYHLHRDDYGSSFDNNHVTLQICKDCEPEHLGEWFNEESITEGYYTTYQHEQNILDFINTLPIQGQELFWARCSDGACAEYMDAQDWIDYKLGILPHEKCKEYGRYSPQEIKAYQERFPICQYVKIKKYEDGSQYSCCNRLAFGDENGQVDIINPSSECYECVSFKVREGEMVTVDMIEEEKKRIREQIELLEKKYKELED